MKERMPLKPNTELRFKNRVNGQMDFVVTDVYGQGGSCIVYNAYYLNNKNTRNTVRIKECYPYKLHLTRAEDNCLIATEAEERQFAEYKQRMVTTFEVAHNLHESRGLTNLTINMYDIYEANNTVYIVSSYSEGNSLKNVEIDSLATAVRIALSIAKSISRIHKRGYLYLDIKPENIFIYEETYDLIQLFDFDSMIPIGITNDLSDYRISYSVGFAALEQKKGLISQIGVYTDIFSLGALLYYMLFGRAPLALDCGFEAEYDYNSLVFGTNHQNKVYKELTKFFHNTLQSYSRDRYQDMENAVEQLELILKYADLPVPFICSSYVSNIGNVIGRTAECNVIRNWLLSEEHMIFVTGMGGIGKSTIVRKFVMENPNGVEHIVYLKFKDSICNTIVDDLQFCISGCEREEVETAKDYYFRKLKMAKKLTSESSILFVIDNFDGVLDDDFEELMQFGWKFIFVTRSEMSKYGYPVLAVDRFTKQEDLRLLFENNLGRRLECIEYRKFNRIVEKVLGHTLVLVLIAKQIANSYLTVDEAECLVEENGFSDMALEKVNYEQDGKKFNNKISSIIKAIYNTSELSAMEMQCLKLLSIFGNVGVNIKRAQKFLGLETLDVINSLRDLGWIEVTDNLIQMHPLVLETIYQIEWTDAYRKIAVNEMELQLKQILQIKGKSEYDLKTFYYILDTSKAVVDSCNRDNVLRSKAIFKDLLCKTLINLPREQENYILKKADQIFNDITYKNTYAVMKLYDYVAYIFCQKKDYKMVERYLGEAEVFAKSCKSHYIWGLFFDMQGDFYDTLLDGEYGTEDEGQKRIFKLLLKSIEKSIEHMKKSKYKLARDYYAKYLLNKAAILIRNTTGESKKIKRLICTAETVMRENLYDNREIQSIYHLIKAWYYTLCEPNKEKILFHLKEEKEIDNHRKLSALDRVDYYYIPAANMMAEMGDCTKAICFLEEAYALCDMHKGSIAFIRKRSDLLQYQFEIFSEEEDMKSCCRKIDYIDALLEEAGEYGMSLDGLNQMRKEILLYSK